MNASRTITVKPLVPWMISLAAVVLVQMVMAHLASGEVLDIAVFALQVAQRLLMAQVIGLVFNQLLRLIFVNYILMLGYLAYVLERTLYYISVLTESTGLNISGIEWQTKLCWAELAVIIVLMAAALVLLIASLVKQFGKPKNKQKLYTKHPRS